MSQFDDFKQDLRAVIHGNNTMDGVYITLRMRLKCEIFRNGKAIPGKVFDVLNEVVVDRGSNPYLSKIECYEHNRLITKVSFFYYYLLGFFRNANFHILRISTVTINSHICY
jgi:NAD kinase